MNRSVLLCTAVLAGLSLPAVAQAPPDDQNYQPQPSSQQPAPNAPRLPPQDLSNLVAPVALYPDMLLSQVLAASTYPAEITEAQQWMQGNPGLRGQQLVEAAKQQPWDPSVQALVAFPQVMNMLTRDIQWTTDLGNAFLSQQADVMDAIQRLRASARDNGRLVNTPQQRVTYEQQNGQNAIVIQPTDPQMVYPPIYNPVYVWGPPVYGYYPPLGYPGPGLGISYAVGTFLGGLFAGLLSFGGWGWGLSWLSHGLFLNGLFFSHFGFHGYSGYGFHGGYGYASRAAWVHNPSHRMGVPYGNHYAGSHFGGSVGRGYSDHAGRSGYSGSAYRSGSSYHAGSSYQGSSRQAEAYRGLSTSAARASSNRGGGYNSNGAGSRGVGSAYSARNNSERSANYAGVASHASSRGSYSSGGSSGHGWSAPASHSRSSGGHYSAPKSSGHAKGGGHSGGHSSGGGGHSHGGSHKK
jgi:Protein of unknown function (DUF3300)